MWLGAVYLGVDVRHLAHRVLDEAQLLESIPPEWRPPGPKDNALTREQVAAMLRKELGSLRSEIVALRTAAAVVGDPKRLSDVEALAKKNTRDYWQRLGDVARSEAALQRDSESTFDESNAAKVFAIKSRISRFAAKTVETVPNEGVDPTVAQFAQQLGEWYERSAELYEKAVQIWESPTSAKSRSRLNKEWRAAELQHRHEARLLHERAAALRSTLSRQFSEEFPEFVSTPPADQPQSDQQPTAALQ
jgi:hypothetical protein